MSDPSGAILRNPNTQDGGSPVGTPCSSEDGGAVAQRAFSWIGSLGVGLEVLAAVMVGAGLWAVVHTQRPLSAVALLAGAGGALASGLALRALHGTTVREMAELLTPPEEGEESQGGLAG